MTFDMINKILQRRWFKVLCSLRSSEELEDYKIIINIEDLLRSRNHLGNVGATWDSENNQVLVEVEIEELNKQQAINQVTEDIREIAFATIEHLNNLRIEILKVEPLEN